MSNHQKLPLSFQRKLPPFSIRSRMRCCRADPPDELHQMAIVFVLAGAVEQLAPSGRMEGFIACYLFRAGLRRP